MSFFTRLSQLLIVTAFLVVLTAAQQCYYPNGTPSKDTPCGSGGTCCPASGFCMDNGLCFSAGIVSRGSCTDKTWKSDGCVGICRTVDPGSSVPLTPCSTAEGASTFVCGLNRRACEQRQNIFAVAGGSTLVLREVQVAAIVEPVLKSLENQTCAGTRFANGTCSNNGGATALYTSGQMAGLGIGLTIPLLIASGIAIMFWRKERARHPKLMYQLPDDDPLKPPQITHHAVRSVPVSRDGSDIASFRTVTPSPTGPVSPQHMQSFAERYHAMNKNIVGLQVQAQELDGQPVGSAFRFESSSRSTTPNKNATSANNLEPANRPPNATRRPR